MSKEKFSTDVIDGQGKVGDDNDNTVGDQDAESPDDDIEEQSFSTRQGAPSSDWTVKQKREASSMGGKTSSKMRKLAREVERPRCIGHAVRDDLLAAINQFVSQGCMRFDSFRKVWASRRLSCLHFSIPRHCEPVWVLQSMLAAALDLLMKDDTGVPATEAGVGPASVGKSRNSPPLVRIRAAGTASSPRVGRASASADGGSRLDDPSGPTLPLHEVGPGSLPFQIGALYALYVLQGTQTRRNPQPVRVTARGVVALLMLRRRLKAAGALAIDALAVLERLVRGGAKKLQPAAYSGPGTLNYVDSILPLTTVSASRLHQQTMDKIAKEQVEAAKKAAATMAAAEIEATETRVAEGVTIMGKSSSGTQRAGSASATAAETPRAQRSAQPVQPNIWGPRNRVASAIETTSAGAKRLAKDYGRYSAALRIARSVSGKAHHEADNGTEGHGEKTGRLGADCSINSNPHQPSGEARNKRFQRDLAAMLRGIRSGVDLPTPPQNAHGLESLAHYPLVVPPPASSPPETLSIPSSPLPTLPSQAVLFPRASRARSSSSMSAAAIATAASAERRGTGKQTQTQTQTQTHAPISKQSLSSGRRNVRDHILASVRALEESEENEQGSSEDRNEELPAMATRGARRIQNKGPVSSEQQGIMVIDETSPTRSTSSAGNGLPDEIGEIFSEQDHRPELSQEDGNGSRDREREGEVSDDAIIGATNESPARSLSRSGGTRNTRRGREGRARSSRGRGGSGRSRSEMGGQVSSAAATERSAAARLHSYRETREREQEKEKSDGQGDDRTEEAEEESDEDDEDDELRSFEAVMNDVMTLTSSRPCSSSSSSTTATAAASGDVGNNLPGARNEYDDIKNINYLPPPPPPPPPPSPLTAKAGSKRSRTPEDRLPSSENDDSAGAPAFKKSRDRAPRAHAPGVAARQTQPRRGGRGTGRGKGTDKGRGRGTAVASERTSGRARRVSSIAAVEEAAAARKLEADRVKEAKAAGATRMREGGSQDRHDEEDRGNGGQREEESSSREDESQPEEEDDEELAEMERWTDIVSATVAPATASKFGLLMPAPSCAGASGTEKNRKGDQRTLSASSTSPTVDSNNKTKHLRERKEEGTTTPGGRGGGDGGSRGGKKAGVVGAGVTATSRSKRSAAAATSAASRTKPSKSPSFFATRSSRKLPAPTPPPPPAPRRNRARTDNAPRSEHEEKVDLGDGARGYGPNKGDTRDRREENGGDTAAEYWEALESTKSTRSVGEENGGGGDSGGGGGGNWTDGIGAARDVQQVQRQKHAADDMNSGEVENWPKSGDSVGANDAQAQQEQEQELAMVAGDTSSDSDSGEEE